MTMISYAQNAEDVLLNRVFADRQTGFYVDVGAAHPVGDSVTKHFYDKGWRGINVEPVAGFVALLNAERPRDTNLEVALSDHEGALTLYDGPAGDGWSTLSPEVAEERRAAGVPFTERDVKVTTLARVLEDHADQPIDFLKIDVEGHEREVLAGHDWERWRPVVLVVEATVPHSGEPNHEQWEGLVLENGYDFAHFDGINRFYVRSEDSALLRHFRSPANYLDDFLHHRCLEEGRAQMEGRYSELLVRAENDLGEVRDHRAMALQVLAETRQQLVVSEMALSDARIQLTACQAALASIAREAEAPPARPSRRLI